MKPIHIKQFIIVNDACFSKIKKKRERTEEKGFLFRSYGNLKPDLAKKIISLAFF